ncbi:GNAT family N-acetyltransferase [Caballeronia hypogeia]|uniref:GNAT family N-acetyltransferase n=1 Tax=Caballeronia hypogeia TaxID=1777140 RepID=UPI0035B539EC
MFAGNAEKGRLSVSDLASSNGVFHIARTMCGTPLGCGAFWHFDKETAEVIRLYSRPNACGVGHLILQCIESEATARGYRRLLFAMTAVNLRAIRFYERNGFTPVQRYGAYANRLDVQCFQKVLRQTLDD